MRLKQLRSRPRRDEVELIVWVRAAQNEIEDHGELNVRLREFATELLKRGLIAKVQFLQAMESSDSAAAGAKSAPIYSKVTNSKFFVSALDAIVVTKEKIIKFAGQLLIWLKHLKLIFQRALETLTTLVRSAANKPRRLRETIRGRDNYLRNLLTTSFDAVVVTDGDHRFVQANSRALDLFGISERNITMFTMDAFLPHRHIAELDENGAPFVHRRERHGECQIKRLDGSLLVAEYTFVSNVAPRRHLYRFQGLAPRRIMPVSCSQRHWAMN
jgi:PAS domain S-box-containing protein